MLFYTNGGINMTSSQRNHFFHYNFILICFILVVSPIFALNQIVNSHFDSDSSNWTLDNQIDHDPLSTFDFDSSEGNSAGSFYGYTPTGSSNNRRQDGIIQQTFTTPKSAVNARISMDYKNTWNNKPDLLGIYATLRISGSNDYPNETVAVTILSEQTKFSTPAHGSWTSISPINISLDKNVKYIYRIYWNHQCDKNEAAGTYVDNLVCNTSPSGLHTTASGSSIILNWNDSTGTTTLDHYNVYRSTTSGGPYSKIGDSTSSDFEDSNPPNAEVIYYVVTDVDTDGVESPYSPEAMYIKVTVRDGLGNDESYSFFKDIAECNWNNVKASILRYEVALGTTKGGADINNWTSVGLASDHIFTGISLNAGTKYYASVRVVDNDGVVQGGGNSDGFLVRNDRALTDTASSTFFNNARVLDQIDTTSDENSIRPKLFSGSGGDGYWRYKMPVTVTEPGVTSRINAPCRIQFSVPSGEINDVSEIRVGDSNGNEVPSYNLDTSTTNIDLVFLVNMPKSGTKKYWIYWGNNGVSASSYSFTNAASLTSMLEYTPYYSRKNMPKGLEDVPLAYNYGYDDGVDFERSGNYGAYRDDCRSDPFDLPWSFYFFGTDIHTNWYSDSNGHVYHDSTDYKDYSNTWDEFTGASTRWTDFIAPIWQDFKYDDQDYPQNPGVFRDDESSPDRVVFTWRCNRYSTQDDIYIFQTVLYSTGDIAHRYGFMSTLAILGPDGTYDKAVNTEHTVGISLNDDSHWLTNTPLKVGISKTPTAFFQCCDAFRNNYTTGNIEGGNVGDWVSVAHMESMVFDSTVSAPDWQKLEYDCTGNDGRLLFSVRTGPTELPELGGWSDWTEIATATSNGSADIPSPDKRYLQYKVVFQRNSNGTLPTMEEVRLIYGGISVEKIIANLPNGVSQGQTGIQVQAQIRNFYSDAVDLKSSDLSFSLGSFTYTLTDPSLPVSIAANDIVTATFSVSVNDDSPVGTSTIQGLATATAGSITFADTDANEPYLVQIKKKANLVITKVETTPTHVDKGQNSVPVRIYMTNLGEVPYRFDGATLTFSIGDYTQSIVSPSIGTVINAGESFIATISVNILSDSPSGVSQIDATASGTNTFSNKVTDDTESDITDSWTVQNPAQLVLEEVTASDTVFRGQKNAAVMLRVSNPGEAIANWNSSDILSHFTLGTYDSVYAVSSFPLKIPGGLEITATYGVDIAIDSATGTSDVDADISGTDNNTLYDISCPQALLPASWTIYAESIKTYKDASFKNESSSFNRPESGDTLNVYAQANQLEPSGEFVVRWFAPDNTDVYDSDVKTADDNGTITSQYTLDDSSSYGTWKISVTNPVNTVTYCTNVFDVVTPASLSIDIQLPDYVSVGQPFVGSLTYINSGGAAIDGAYPSDIEPIGAGLATVTSGPNADLTDVSGNSQATATWNFIAKNPGDYTASATAYGYDANSGAKLVSDAQSSNICTIQNPPDVVVTSVTTDPDVVYLNQTNIIVNVDLQNNGSATAVIDVASLDFTLGSYQQKITSPDLPYELLGEGDTVEIQFNVTVNSDSDIGNSDISAYIHYYDENYNASETVIDNSTPKDSWEVKNVGIKISRHDTFTPEQYAFNQGQTVYFRAFGLTADSSWYRVRLYDSKIAQGDTGPSGDVNVSPQLSADDNGYVDYQYTLPSDATIGDWSVILEDDPDEDGSTRDKMRSLQYFKVQYPGNLVASLSIASSSVFVGDEFAVTLIASNTTTDGSTIDNATASPLIKDSSSDGYAELVSGPEPASASVDALTDKTFTWIYKATQDTGLSGKFALTASLSHSLSGIDTNTGDTVQSGVSTSNGLVIYRRAIHVASDVIDFSSVECGKSISVGDVSIDNAGNYPLEAVSWIKTDLNGSNSNKIGKVNLDLSPNPLNFIDAGSNKLASATITIPYNQKADTYIATMSVYNDRNGNGLFDIDEVYDLFQAKVVVPDCKDIVVFDKQVDLGGWADGQTTTGKNITVLNSGNLDLSHLKFKEINGTNTFSIDMTPATLDSLAVADSYIATISATVSSPKGCYAITMTSWADDDNDGDIDTGEASATFVVLVQVGAKDFTLTSPIDAGVGTPSMVISNFGPTIDNTGDLDLNYLTSDFRALSDGNGHTIASEDIAINPDITFPIHSGDSQDIKMKLYVPAGQISGTYSATQYIFEDDNQNGVCDDGEASASFDLQVEVPAIELVQVLLDSVDVGGIAPGTNRTISFPCRNIGNVDLNDLRWEKVDLNSNSDTLANSNVSFPPSEPFSVAAGEKFDHDVNISIPSGQPYGDYASSNNGYWIYNDDNPSDSTRSSGEASYSFTLTCQVGKQALDIAEDSISVSGDPNKETEKVTFNVKNTGTLDLNAVTATASALVSSDGSHPDISEDSNLFDPALIGAISVDQTKQSQWSVNIPATTPAGDYVATLTVWEDSDNNGEINGAEALDKASLHLTVNAVRVIDVIQDSLDLGWCTENSTLSGNIEIYNAGNIDLTNLTAQSADISSSIDTIASNDITFDANPIGSLAIGNSIIATVTVNVGSPKADGTYNGDQIIYDDYNSNDGSYDSSKEESDTFNLIVKVGKKSVYETDSSNPPIDFGSQDPNNTYTQSFKVYAGTAVPLSKLKWKNITAFTSGAHSFPISNLTFTPTGPFSVSGGENTDCTASLIVDQYQYAGDYTATTTIWEDENDDDIIDDNEASATFNLKITVNSQPALVLNDSQIDFGNVAQGATVSVDIGFRNTGNIDLTSFSWLFSDLQGADDSIADSNITYSSTFSPDPVTPGKYGTNTVSIYAPPDKITETYGYTGGQSLCSSVSGNPTDSCEFKCNVITGGPDLASGTVYQEIATSTFANQHRYILSAWVCPASGTAKIGFVQTKSDGSVSTGVDIQIASSGQIIPESNNATIDDYGITRSLPFTKSNNEDFKYYRIYLTFDLKFDDSVASKTMIILQNTSPKKDNPHDVWFDGIQLEQADNSNMKKPTDYSPHKKIISPNSAHTMDEGKFYYEW